MKRVLLAPLDPVHDNAVKLLRRRLCDAGYDAIALPPGTTEAEAVEKALALRPAALLVSRTLGYQVAEILGRLVDLAEAAGLRQTTRLGVGGMAITREVGAELGFDGVFVGELDLDAVIAFIEGRPHDRRERAESAPPREKPDLTAGYSYKFRDAQIEGLLSSITDQFLTWAEGKTTDGIHRAELRRAMIDLPPDDPRRQTLQSEYLSLCDETIQSAYRQGTLPGGVRRLGQSEIDRLPELLAGVVENRQPLRRSGDRPLVFIQYGTGCPVMDVLHARISESWGADGLLHFDPSWGAQREGLLEGLLTHEHDGTILTLDNLRYIRRFMNPATLWNVRGHRGLNTPETQILAHAAGADLLKINIPYGSTGGGTDPERLAVDGIYSVRLAAEFGLPFDIPGNDELSGVPPHKTFAGLLVMTMLGLKLGAKPIPKPLLCLSPYMTVEGLMDENFVEMNLAKLAVWEQIVDAPVWPGEPVGFMTHTPERVQSAVATAAHVALAASAGVAAVTMSSTDEAYSKGPISAQARVDSLRAVREMLRFMGSTTYQRTPRSIELQEQIYDGIVDVLKQIEQRGDFVAAIYEGLLGSPEDGLYPGRVGRGTVRQAAAEQ